MIDLAKQRLLVIAPHPDDEVIGCGGLIAKVKARGGEVFVQFLTVGDTNDASAAGFSSANERHIEVERVADLLQFDGYDIAFPGDDHHLLLDAIPQAAIIDAIERSGACSVDAVRPTVVAFPDCDSYNQDHRAAAVATRSALRPGDSRLRHQPAGVLMYEQIADQWNSGFQVTPSFAVELDEAHLSAKIDAMRTYKSQIREHPSTRPPEALEAMAFFRGAHFGCARAEAYKTLRWKV